MCVREGLSVRCRCIEFLHTGRWSYLSLSRFNHWPPGRETHPEVVPGTTECPHEIADTLLPPAEPVLHPATTLDTTVDMLDAPPPLAERLVRPWLLSRELLAAGLLGRPQALHVGQ